MSFTIESLIEEWDGLGVVTSYHRETGTWIFVALHDATLGRPTGGCRLKSYGSPASALRDAMRLAEGMTYKWASIGFEYGGGKSVLAVPGPIEGVARRALFTHFAGLLNRLGGAYGVGPDLGTNQEDMAFLATITSAVVGSDGAGHPVDPSPITAAGVHAGIVAWPDSRVRNRGVGREVRARAGCRGRGRAAGGATSPVGGPGTCVGPGCGSRANGGARVRRDRRRSPETSTTPSAMSTPRALLARP